MKRRVAVVGGLVLAAGVFLGWLGKGFLGLGDGGGLGSGSGDPSQVRVLTPDDGNADTGKPQNETVPVSDRSETETVAGSAEGRVDVVIDGETYLALEGSSHQPIELDDLIERVKASEGNSAGVRVRISRRGTSIPVAEDKLEQALLNADIPRNAIHWVEETAP